MNKIFLLLSCLLISCNNIPANDDPIIGEWYKIGTKMDDSYYMEDPFVKDVNSFLLFKKDSFYHQYYDGVSLDNKLKLIEKGNTYYYPKDNYSKSVIDYNKPTAWQKVKNVYKTSYDFYYFSIDGDTLISHIIDKGEVVMNRYYFKND